MSSTDKRRPGRADEKPSQAEFERLGLEPATRLSQAELDLERAALAAHRTAMTSLERLGLEPVTRRSQAELERAALAGNRSLSLAERVALAGNRSLLPTALKPSTAELAHLRDLATASTRVSPAVQPATTVEPTTVGPTTVEPTTPAVLPDDEAVPLPTFEAHQVRQAFVVFVALRCQGLQVLPGVNGARQLLGVPVRGKADGTVEKYLREDKFANAYGELMAWAAKRDDRWPRIWAAFRSAWEIPAEIKGPAQDRTD